MKTLFDDGSIVRHSFRQRAIYWAVIICLVVWVAIEREQTERYRYADAYIRADNRALRARVLGINEAKTATVSSLKDNH